MFTRERAQKSRMCRGILGDVWFETWSSREIFLQGNKVVEAYDYVCNQSKDQVNNARHEVNLVIKEDSQWIQAIYIYSRTPVTRTRITRTPMLTRT